MRSVSLRNKLNVPAENDDTGCERAGHSVRPGPTAKGRRGEGKAPTGRLM